MRLILASLCLLALSASLVADEIRGKVVSITARAAKIGLWADPAPMPPRECRKKQKIA
jgi:hypothetical protein